MSVVRYFMENKLFLLVHLKGLIKGFSQKSFSQFGEDIVLNSIFKGKTDGYFVDVGAYHPFHYSNTHLLYKSGWRGINIEPNPVTYNLFKFHRKHDMNINSGVATQVTEENYYIFNHQSCNTFSEEQKDLVLKKKFIKLLRTKKIRCRPLQDILDDAHFTHAVDLLNIDVEGKNLSVLHSLDWERTKPRVVCIEDDNFSFESKSDIYKFLKEKGYVLHSKVGLSCIYMQR